MSSSYTPGFEETVLTVLHQLKSDVSELKSDVSELKSDVSELKSDVSGMKKDIETMKTDIGLLKEGQIRLEDQLGDFRDEFHAESRATRTLLNQAFEHISDQLAHDGGQSFVPAYPRTHR